MSAAKPSHLNKWGGKPSHLFKCEGKLSIGEVERNQYLLIKNKPCQVLERTHTMLGRGQGCLSVKLKNLSTGEILTETFKGNQELLQIELEKISAQFLYRDKDILHFLREETLEEYEISLELVGEQIKFLKPDQTVSVLFYEGRPLKVELPIKVELKVIEAEPAERGNTAKGRVNKTVTLETGATLPVPLFIKEGDVIRVNTQTGQYVERVKGN